MATIGKTDYLTYAIFDGMWRGLKFVAGGNGAAYNGSDLAENDTILHGMERVFAALWTYTESPLGGPRLYLDLSTPGQVTITDEAIDGKKGTILILGQ